MVRIQVLVDSRCVVLGVYGWRVAGVGTWRDRAAALQIGRRYEAILGTLAEGLVAWRRRNEPLAVGAA